MAKKVAQLASVIVLSAVCHGPALSQQQGTGRSSVLGGSTPSQQSTSRSSVLGGSTSSQPSDAIPPDFRGEITYTGTYSGSVKTKADRMRNLSLNEALRSATSSQTLPLGGEYQLTVRYEGNRIYGAFVSRSATGPNGASIDPQGSFVGTRNGTTCTYTSQQTGGPATTAYCGRGRWEWGSDDVFNPQGHKVALRIVAKQTGMVDFAERERQQATAVAEQRRIATERARQAQAESAIRPSIAPRENALPQGTAGGLAVLERKFMTSVNLAKLVGNPAFEKATDWQSYSGQYINCVATGWHDPYQKRVDNYNSSGNWSGSYTGDVKYVKVFKNTCNHPIYIEVQMRDMAGLHKWYLKYNPGETWETYWNWTFEIEKIDKYPF